MSRMHNSKKGQSGSTRPHLEETPDWVPLDENEVEDLIIELAKQGRTASEIGFVLRDQYGVPNVKLLLDKSISDVLEENDLAPEIPEDLLALIEKAVNLNEHLKDHPKNKSNRRGLQLIESKIRRLVDYYKKEGELDEDWEYSMSKAEIITQ